jgi:ubiquitin
MHFFLKSDENMLMKESDQHKKVEDSQNPFILPHVV